MQMLENWYALGYMPESGTSVLVRERFRPDGIFVSADVMAGPLKTWEAEGDAVMKNRAAIAAHTHVSKLETRKEPRKDVQSERAAPYRKSA